MHASTEDTAVRRYRPQTKKGRDLTFFPRKGFFCFILETKHIYTVYMGFKEFLRTQHVQCCSRANERDENEWDKGSCEERCE